MKKIYYIIISSILGVLPAFNSVSAFCDPSTGWVRVTKSIMAFGVSPSLIFFGILYLALSKNKKSKRNFFIFLFLSFLVLFLIVFSINLYEAQSPSNSVRYFCI